MGAAGVITGAALVAVSASTASRADNEMIAARSEELYRQAVGQRTVGFVALGVGAVGAGLATFFFLTD